MTKEDIENDDAPVFSDTSTSKSDQEPHTAADGSLVTSEGQQDGRHWLQEFNTGKEKPSVSLSGHEGIIVCLDYNNAGTMLATGCANGIVNIWSLQDGLVIQTHCDEAAITNLVWMNDHGLAVTSKGSHEITVIKVTKDQREKLRLLAHCRMRLIEHGISGLSQSLYLRAFLERLPTMLQDQYNYEEVIEQKFLVAV